MKFPIKYKLASIAFLILVPLLVFAVYHSLAMIDRGKEDIQADNLVLASHLANELDDLIESSFATLQALAQRLNRNHVIILNRQMIPRSHRQNRLRHVDRLQHRAVTGNVQQGGHAELDQLFRKRRMGVDGCAAS